MSNCCSKNTHKPKCHVCPEHGQHCGQVAFKTILHHVKEPWMLALEEQAYYFCDDPDCGVVYFGQDGTTILKDQLRTRVGIKEETDDALICYCFGVSKIAAKTDEKIKAFVIEQTKNALCACSTRNPSGKCCLKDFPHKTSPK